MPELPEVEHARKLVHAHCVNKICTNVIFPSAETGVLDEENVSKISGRNAPRKQS